MLMLVCALQWTLVCLTSKPIKGALCLSVEEGSMVISEVNSFAFWGDQTLNIAQVSAASAESDSFCNSVFQRCKPQQNRCSKHGATLEKEKGE